MWPGIIAAVPQESFLGPLLSNVFLNYFFLDYFKIIFKLSITYTQKKILSGYAGVNTLNATSNAMDKVKKALSNDFGIIGNCMKT